MAKEIDKCIQVILYCENKETLSYLNIVTLYSLVKVEKYSTKFNMNGQKFIHILYNDNYLAFVLSKENNINNIIYLYNLVKLQAFADTGQNINYPFYTIELTGTSISHHCNIFNYEKDSLFFFIHTKSPYQNINQKKKKL
jgi:hypothetical protein